MHTCRACYGVLRYVMEAGAKGCEVIVTGKLRAARAKAMKFKDGYMISSGNPTKEFIDSAVRHVLLRQGCLGIKARAALVLRAVWSAVVCVACVYIDECAATWPPPGALVRMCALRRARGVSLAGCIFCHVGGDSLCLPGHRPLCRKKA